MKPIVRKGRSRVNNPRELDGSRAQTLSRGIQCLEELAAARGPLTIADLASGLGVHRSIAYRIVRTLEDHHLVRRDSDGVELGVGLIELARSVARGWEDNIRTAVRSLADELTMTTYIAVRDGSDCVVVISEEPRGRDAVVTYHPGYRHSLKTGADGRAIQSALLPEEWKALGMQITETAKIRSVAARGYANSTGEVIPGVSAVAVPMRLRAWGAAALAVVFVGSKFSVGELARRLLSTAAEIQRAA
jgi:DNA-binding IclR family transcriptional regulator